MRVMLVKGIEFRVGNPGCLVIKLTGPRTEHSHYVLGLSLQRNVQDGTDTSRLTLKLRRGRSGASRNYVYIEPTAYTHSRIRTHTQGSLTEIPNSDTMEPDRSQYDRPATCVIAQQYFSATFVP